MTREEACSFGLGFENTYLDKPFRKADWQLIRVKDSKKAFLGIYDDYRGGCKLRTFV